MPRPENQPKKFKYLYRKNGCTYFRSPIDGKLTPLPKEGSAEFDREHAKCLYGLASRRAAKADTGTTPTPPIALDPTKRITVYESGSIGRALLVYFGSNKFRTGTKSGTKTNYQRNANVLRDRIGDVLLRDMDVDRIDIYSEEIAAEYGATVADAHVRLISLAWKVCRKYAEFGIKLLANPTEQAEKHYGGAKRPHRPWTEDEQDLFMRTAPDYLRLAKVVQHFLVQRGGDGVKIKWTDFDGRGIYITPEKTDAIPDPLPYYNRCPKPLLEALRTAPRLAETILVNSRGKPWHAARGLSHAFRKHLIKIGLWQKGARNPVLHGLRKNGASEVAELLVGTAGVKSVGNWKSNSQAEWYAQHASQVAMNDSVVDRWDEVLEAKRKKRAPRLRVVK